MNKIIFSMILSLVCCCAAAQDSTKTVPDSANIAAMITEMFTAKVDVPIDKTIFKSAGSGNMYFAEDEKAFVMLFSIPSGIEEAKETMDRERKKKDGYKKLESGELTSNSGGKIFFESGSMKAKGKKMLMDMYAIEAGGEQSILMMGAYLEKDKEKYRAELVKYAKAAKLAPKKKE